MWTRSLCLFLLLLPSLALAQEPPPLTWSMQASACPADETASPSREVTTTLLRYRPGTFFAGAVDPLGVRCPVTGQGTQRATTLEVLSRDPDGTQGLTRVVVEVFNGSRRDSWFDSNLHGADVPTWQRQARLLANTLHHFGRSTSVVHVSLRRRSRFVMTPRVSAVRLSTLLPPEEPGED
jgi:hypothetical protein